ncbi:MAG: DUF3842 family protein [Lachnospiraceae bacterium]|nr:DUF3842 family protein [Lachnospiraceae bacterium]
MKVVVIDGQGGKMGKALIEQLKIALEGVNAELYAIGTNGSATAAMMKAGADYGATGERPAIVAVRNADLIVGPVGIVVADSFLGELTPAMATAIGQSPAVRLLLPVNRCHSQVIGVRELSMNDMVKLAAAKAREIVYEANSSAK